VNCETHALLGYWDFHGKSIDEAWYLLDGLLGIHLSSRRLVVFLDIHYLIFVHSMLDFITPFFYVTCVILLTMILICTLIMHAILNLTLHNLGTILTLF